MLTRITILMVALIAMPTQAQDETEEESGPWSGNVSFGFLSTSGNTENSNLNGNLEVGYTTGRWNHLFDAYAINASESDVTTARAHGAGWKSEWNLSEHNFLFGQLSYRKDRFSGFPTQFSQTVGYGRRFIDTTAHTLSAEAGVGARQSERADGIDENDFIVSGGLNYKWTISESANFTQDLKIEYGENNTFTESVSAVSTNIVGALALVVSYTIRNNSDVLPATVNTDTFTALSLEYGF